MIETKYVGFWARFIALLIDCILISGITAPLVYVFYGEAYFQAGNKPLIAGPADFLITWVLPTLVIILFWVKKRGTPGKLTLSMQVVDAKTGQNLTVSQSLIRYLGYFVSALPLCLGYFWIAFDDKKQGWHDKMAGSVVIRK